MGHQAHLLMHQNQQNIAHVDTVDDNVDVDVDDNVDNIANVDTVDDNVDVDVDVDVDIYIYFNYKKNYGMTSIDASMKAASDI
ncbi:4683_t:CDS:2 [Entrophospora sp. SA101]|nr:4683_t:CDS:2 [Entrophospora sp. SA101]